MIAYHQDLAKNIESINQVIDAYGPFGQVQKITSTSHFVQLDVRLRGKSISLLIGRGEGFEGIFQGGGIPAEFRLRDPFLEYLRSHFKSGRITSINLHPTDRIVVINYVRVTEAAIGLFWKGPKLYFSHLFFEDGMWRLFSSWEMKEKKEFLEVSNITDMVFKNFEMLGIRNEAAEEIGRVIEGQELLLRYKKEIIGKNGEQRTPRRERKFQKRKKEKIEDDLRKIEEFISLEPLLKKDELELGTSSEIIVAREKIRIPKEWGYHKRKEIVYDRIKRLKYAKKIVETRLQDVLKSFSENKQVEVKKIPLPKPVMPIWESGAKRVVKEFIDTTKNYDEFSYGKMRMAVGKSAHSNDQLRRDYSKRGGWWFHAEGVPGTHLVLSGIENPISDQNLINLIGSIIRDYSKLDSLEISLMYGDVTEVKSMKGSPGMVLLKRPRFIRAVYEAKWREILAIS